MGIISTPPTRRSAIAKYPDRWMLISKTPRPLLECADGPNEGMLCRCGFIKIDGILLGPLMAVRNVSKVELESSGDDAGFDFAYCGEFVRCVTQGKLAPRIFLREQKYERREDMRRFKTRTLKRGEGAN